MGEEEAELLKEAATEDHTVLLIDARPPMLQPDPNEGGRCPLASSLEAATAVLRRIIMQSGSGARNKVCDGWWEQRMHAFKCPARMPSAS